MANPEHLDIIKQGVEKWNAWRKERPEESVDLSLSNLHDAPLSGANLGNADLRGANFNGSDLSGANLDHSDLSYNSPDFAKRALAGEDLTIGLAATLLGSNLAGARLYGANLCFANLNQSSLVGAYLWSSCLLFASLERADVSKAHLYAADLSATRLRQARLREADLQGVNLSHALLSRADFHDATVGYTMFIGNDLSSTEGLGTLTHTAPSAVSIDTIYNSHGKIPEVFLRGCGVPEEFIRYIGSMVGRPIEFYSCFISYSTQDQEFAERLYNDLQGNGVRCWFAPHNIQGGRKIHEQIDDAIRLYDKLLLILSERSMNSGWVQTDIAKARKRESEETKRAAAEAEAQTPGSSRDLTPKRMLFPVTLVPFDPTIKDWECFDADTGKDSAREIREYFIPDFSNWKDHDAYQKAFQRLVADLKAETSKL